MKEKFKTWLDGCGVASGLLGGGLRLPDGSCISHSFNENCPRDRLEEALRALSEFLPALANSGLTPRWQTWTFEKGQIRLAERADGLLLGLAIQPNSPAAENLDLLTDEFFNLDLTD